MITRYDNELEDITFEEGFDAKAWLAGQTGGGSTGAPPVRYNEQTGEAFEWRNGQWVPAPQWNRAPTTETPRTFSSGGVVTGINPQTGEQVYQTQIPTTQNITVQAGEPVSSQGAYSEAEVRAAIQSSGGKITTDALAIVATYPDGSTVTFDPIRNRDGSVRFNPTVKQGPTGGTAAQSYLQKQAVASTSANSTLAGARAAPAAARSSAARTDAAPPEFATSAGGNQPFAGAAQDDPNTQMDESADPGITTFATPRTAEGWQSGVKYSPEGDFLGIDFATGPNSSMYIRPEHAIGRPASAHDPSSGYITSYGVTPSGNPERDVGTMLGIMTERAVKQREYMNLGLSADKALAIANQEVTNKLKAITEPQFRQQLEPQPEEQDFVSSPLAGVSQAFGGSAGRNWWEEEDDRILTSGPTSGPTFYQATGGSGVGGMASPPPRPTSRAGLMLHESYNPRGGGSTDWINPSRTGRGIRMLQGRILMDMGRQRRPERPGPEGFNGTWDEYLEWLQNQRVTSGGMPSRTHNPYPPIMPGEDDVGTAGGEGGYANSGGFPYRPVPARNTGAPSLLMARGGSGLGGYNDFATGEARMGGGGMQDDFMTQEEMGVFGLNSGHLYSVVGEGRDGIGGEQKPERFTVTPTQDFATAPAARQTQSGRELMPDMSPKARKAFAILSA